MVLNMMPFKTISQQELTLACTTLWCNETICCAYFASLKTILWLRSVLAVANIFPKFLLECMWWYFLWVHVLSVVKNFLTDKVPCVFGSVESSDNTPWAFQKYKSSRMQAGVLLKPLFVGKTVFPIFLLLHASRTYHVNMAETPSGTRNLLSWRPAMKPIKIWRSWIKVFKPLQSI